MAAVSQDWEYLMRKQVEHGLEAILFAGRWLQAPLFLGLIFASLLYAYRFLLELKEITLHINEVTSEELLIGVLGLVDMTMVANLIIMVVIGGYTLFVSKLHIADSEDRPEWLDKTTAATLKIKLASSLIGVSGIHLLKTFIELSHNGGHAPDNMAVMWQVIIHGVFLLSSIVLAVSERILHPPHHH